MAARLTSYVVVGIVAATLIAGLIVRAQRDDSDGPVDLIVHNAVVFTGNRSDERAEALAVRANQILKVGTNREIVRLRRPQTVVIDAKGAAVLPGFNDAYVHLIEGGLSLEGVDLTGAATLEEALERVRSWAEVHPDKRWISGRGWSFGAEVSPTRQALDAVAADRPVYLRSHDGKAAWVNSRALRLSKIVARTKDPENGRIVRDRKREPTGVLEGSAADLVAVNLPTPTRDDRMRALQNALAQAHSLGITSLQTTVADHSELEMFDAVRQGSSVEVRLYHVLQVRAAADELDIAALDPVLARYADDPLAKSGAASVPLESLDDDGLNRTVRLLDARGWQVSIEAETAEKAEQARDAFTHARRSNGSRAAARRHRIERRNGVFTEMANAKAIGSDWPNGPLAPMRVVQKAVAHHALSDALRAYTYGGAFASHDEKRKGTLEPGMLADIVVLSADIFTLQPSQLDTVKVAYTIFDGRIVYPFDRRTTTFP